MSLKDKLAIAASKTNEVMSKVFEYTKVIGALGPKPNIYNYMAAASELLVQGSKDLTETGFNVKTIEELEFVSGRMLKPVKTAILPNGKIVGAIPKTDMLIVEIYDLTFIVSKEHGTISIPKDQCEFKSKAAIARLLWEEHKGILQVHSLESYYLHVDSSMDFPTATSEHADKMTEYVKQCMDAGKNRSFFIHGVPGTGKTTVANTVCKRLFNRILFINTRGVSPQVIVTAIKDLSPEAVILNEIDKCDNMESQLESLESINRHVKLLIAVSNTVKNVPPSVLRPGRFSNIIHINRLDDHTLDSVMKFECSKEMREEIKTWPIAFISEINDRMDVGIGSFDSHFKEMKHRVEKLRGAEDDKNEM